MFYWRSLRSPVTVEFVKNQQDLKDFLLKVQITD